MASQVSVSHRSLGLGCLTYNVCVQKIPYVVLRVYNTKKSTLSFYYKLLVVHVP